MNNVSCWHVDTVTPSRQWFGPIRVSRPNRPSQVVQSPQFINPLSSPSGLLCLRSQCHLVPTCIQHTLAKVWKVNGIRSVAESQMVLYTMGGHVDSWPSEESFIWSWWKSYRSPFGAVINCYNGVFCTTFTIHMKAITLMPPSGKCLLTSHLNNSTNILHLSHCFAWSAACQLTIR